MTKQEITDSVLIAVWLEGLKETKKIHSFGFSTEISLAQRKKPFLPLKPTDRRNYVENGEGGYFECLEYNEFPLTGSRVEHTFPDVVIFSEEVDAEVYEMMRSNDCFRVIAAATADPTTAAPQETENAPIESPEEGGATGTETVFAPDDVCMETCGCTSISK